MVAKGDIWTQSIEGTDKELMDVNKAQLKKGMGSDGEPLPKYSYYMMESGKTYDEEKNIMNPDNEGRYDMDWTGYSLSHMNLALEGVKIHISSLGHAQEWDAKLGGDIFGVYENSALESYRQQFLYPLLVRLIREQTGAK